MRGTCCIGPPPRQKKEFLWKTHQDEVTGLLDFLNLARLIRDS